MRVISQSELLRATRLELHALLRLIAAELPCLPEGSHELRIAHYNLHNIRVALSHQAPHLRMSYGCRGLSRPRHKSA
jgi:hypothetical protein